eukprot:9916173-Heterocapsa_arctica.AAC.1
MKQQKDVTSSKYLGDKHKQEKRTVITQLTTPSQTNKGEKSKPNSDSGIASRSPNSAGTLDYLFTLQRASRAEGIDPHARDHEEAPG